MSQNELERLIEAAAQLKDAVTQLGEAYDAMPTVIDKEHRAIRASDFIAVQEALGDKEIAGQRVEDCFAALTRASDYLASLSINGERPKTLTECVAVLADVAASVSNEGIGAQVLKHQTDGLAKAVKEFGERFQRIKPQIEANRYLVSTMLQNIQDSYRFWMEVAEQVATAYNAQGVQKTQGRNSGFTVKA